MINILQAVNVVLLLAVIYFERRRAQVAESIVEHRIDSLLRIQREGQELLEEEIDLQRQRLEALSEFAQTTASVVRTELRRALEAKRLKGPLS